MITIKELQTIEAYAIATYKEFFAELMSIEQEPFKKGSLLEQTFSLYEKPLFSAFANGLTNGVTIEPEIDIFRRIKNCKNPYKETDEEQAEDFEYQRELVSNIFKGLLNAFSTLDKIEDSTYQTFKRMIARDKDGHVRIRSLIATPMGNDLNRDIFKYFDLCFFLTPKDIIDIFYRILISYKENEKVIAELVIATNYQCNDIYYLKKDLQAESNYTELEPIINAYNEIYYELYHLSKNYGLSIFHIIGNESFQKFYHIID